MLFNSLKFLIFLPVILILYFILPEKIKNLWLLGASYYFYMCWNVEYALLILFSTVITYISGRILEGLKDDTCFGSRRKIWNKRKLVVLVSFSLNLFVLFYFKYFNFFLCQWPPDPFAAHGFFGRGGALWYSQPGQRRRRDGGGGVH